MNYFKSIEIEDSKICYDLDLISMNLWSQNQWENEIKKSNVRGLGIYSDKGIIGTCIFLKIFDEAELRYLVIHPEHRRKGLGKKLFYEFLKECIFENISKVFLEVSNKNIEAINLYNYFGFKTIGLRKKYYKDGSDALIKEKKMLKK